MANTQDFTAIFKDMMGSFPVDTKNMEDVFKNQSALAERLSAANLEAAQKSAELSAKWTQDTLAKFGEVTRAKSEPADYAKSMSEFFSASAEATSEHMAAFADIAKKLQTETLELMLSAGKDMSDDMTAAAKKAGTDAQAATRKAAGNVASK